MLQTAPKDVTRDILSGVIVTGIVLAMSIHLPVFKSVSFLSVPLPILFYRAKLGRNTALMISAAAGAMLAILLGGFSLEMVFFGELLVLGFALGELFGRALSIEKTILWAGCAVLLTGAVGVFLYVSGSGMGVMQLVSNHVAEQVASFRPIMQNMGIPDDALTLMTAIMEKYLARTIPAQMITAFLYIAWASLLLAKPLLERWNLFYPDFGRLDLWKAPEYVVWGLIGSGVMILLPGDVLPAVGLNGLIVIATLYFFQGIAIVSFFFKKKRFSRFLRVFLYVLIALQPVGHGCGHRPL